MSDHDDVPPTLGGRALRGWRQVRCGACGLPRAQCLCDALPTLAVRTRVLVVMHHIEALRSTNTGRLAARMLTGAAVRVHGLRDAPPRAPLTGRALVLFPGDGHRVLCASDRGDDLTLLVPDGTWTQARRIARRDVDARDAERVCLPAAGESAYALRQHDGGLCTLEAIASAMAVLEGGDIARAMLDAFAVWRARAVEVRRGAAR